MQFTTSISDIILRTRNVKSLRFARPSSLDYKPGQFMFVTIKNGTNELRKHFTISSSPTEKDYLEFTKKLTESEFSNALNASKIGDSADISVPYGNFTFEGEYKKICMLSGGIGITPLRSICRYCTDMQLGTEIILIYGNRTEQDIVFREELEKMQEQNKNLKVVFTIDQPDETWIGGKGKINAETMKKEVPDYLERVFYTSGPPGMVEAIVNLLSALGVPEKQIKEEDFPGY